MGQSFVKGAAILGAAAFYIETARCVLPHPVPKHDR